MDTKQHSKIKSTGKQNDTKLKLEVELLKGQLTRALADYDNLTKRVERERENLTKFASIGILSRLLPILDILESAQNHLGDQGLALAINESKELLKENTLEELRAQSGDEFNENHHEAVDSSDTEDENLKGKVSEMVLSGWKFKDGHVLRHAKVKVYKK